MSSISMSVLTRFAVGGLFALHAAGCGHGSSSSPGAPSPTTTPDVAGPTPADVTRALTASLASSLKVAAGRRANQSMGRGGHIWYVYVGARCAPD